MKWFLATVLLKAILAIIASGSVSFYIFWRMQFGRDLDWRLCVLSLLCCGCVIAYGTGLILESF